MGQHFRSRDMLLAPLGSPKYVRPNVGKLTFVEALCFDSCLRFVGTYFINGGDGEIGGP